ncbi:MAG: hypothetical protein KY467_14805 [Gemmatimonadetes bacterium]|nr:hypothetical protein [Gemmatimonadota bacterium]
MAGLGTLVEAWLRHRARSLYDVHVRGYLVLGLLGWHAMGARGSADPWILRSVVWGIVALVLSATLYEGWSRRRRGRDTARP